MVRGTYRGNRHAGIVLLNTRINFHQGNPPPPNKYEWEEPDYWHGSDPRWHVVKHIPKRDTWAISTHRGASKHHRIEYQLVATHKSAGTVVKMTVWKCGHRCSSEIQVGKRPNPIRDRCYACSNYQAHPASP